MSKVDQSIALLPPRGQRTECSCGRKIAKAHRVFRGIAFCGTCYARDFKPRPCLNCGASVRLHRSQETGLCRVCERTERRCIRCERPVHRAALLIEGKAVCPGCRRYFPPFPKNYRPIDHESCSVCGKHRRVVRRDPDERPLCSLCSERDRHEEVRAKDESYWREGVLKRHLAIEPRLQTEWTRELLSGFIEYQLGLIPAKRLALALTAHAQRIQTLGRRFGSLEEINSKQLLACYTSEEMRRSQSLLDYLHALGVETPTRDQREDLAEERRIQSLLESVRLSAHAPLVRRFQIALNRPNSKGFAPQRKSQRSSICAACGWVALTGDDALSQESLDRYLRQTPGQRDALSTFIGFIGRAEGIKVSLPAKSPRKRSAISQRGGDDALMQCLGVLGNGNSDFASRRAALAGTLVALFGISLRVVLRLPRESINQVDDGGMIFALPQAELAEVALDLRLVAAIDRYLVDRDRLVGRLDGFLFPGRPLHQHVSEAAVADRLKTLGLSIRVLSMSGVDWIKRAADKAGREIDGA